MADYNKAADAPDGAVQAGLAGLHKSDCWDSDTHEDCLEIVHAVLIGLADGGYVVVPDAGR